MKKYLYFNVAYDDGVITTEDYKYAMRVYAKSSSATLYGFDNNGSCNVIFSK